MALDEAIATSVITEGAPPTVRLYGWDRPALSVGCFQKASDIDVDYCSANGIQIVRRPTGGRAILHDNELTYSFSVRTDREPFSGGLLDSYRKISGVFTLAFSKIGIRAEAKMGREKARVLAESPFCFRSTSFAEVQISRRKIVGSAQKRWPHGLLQQGSIPYTCKEEEMFRIFRVEEAIPPRDYMACVREIIPDLDEAQFEKTVASAFEETFGVTLVPSHPSAEELSLARELQQRKYLRPDWNFRR